MSLMWGILYCIYILYYILYILCWIRHSYGTPYCRALSEWFQTTDPPSPGVWWNWPTKPSFNSMNSIPWIQLMVHNVSVLSVYLLHVSFWHKLHANGKRLNAFLVAIFWFTWFEHRLGFVWPFSVLSDPFQTAGVPQGDINWPNVKLGLQHICPRLFHRIWWSMSSFWKKM